MAGCDYYSCDVCGRKTFYDAEVQYESWDGKRNENPVTHHPWPVGVGAMAVLCDECAKTHAITVAPNIALSVKTDSKPKEV